MRDKKTHTQRPNMDVFKARAKQHFKEMTELFLQHLSRLFPECHETGDAAVYFSGVVANDDAKLVDALQRWLEHLQTPLVDVKYAKAVERLIGQPAVVYHACQYRDVDAMHRCTNSPTAQRLELHDKFKSEVMSAEDKELFWKYVDEMNRHCFEYAGQAPPRVPTRDEIQENIKNKRAGAAAEAASKDDAPSMHGAFQQSFNELCVKLRAPPLLQQASDASVRETIAKWSEYACKTTHKAQRVLCTERDPSSSTAWRR